EARVAHDHPARDAQLLGALVEHVLEDRGGAAQVLLQVPVHARRDVAIDDPDGAQDEGHQGQGGEEEDLPPQARADAQYRKSAVTLPWPGTSTSRWSSPKSGCQTLTE